MIIAVLVIITLCYYHIITSLHHSTITSLYHYILLLSHYYIITSLRSIIVTGWTSDGWEDIFHFSMIFFFLNLQGIHAPFHSLVSSLSSLCLSWECGSTRCNFLDFWNQNIIKQWEIPSTWELTTSVITITSLQITLWHYHIITSLHHATITSLHHYIMLLSHQYIFTS